ncbi:hypothetical protein GCM10027073_19110 [Streptomyces chlorus]|uniref:Uncharacterized protein n=1 Tax=Streptomyces chlorus TaxID=887452 RepID=A0ABW1DUS7_9ACTN
METTRAEVVALVQRIKQADYASEDEVADWPAGLGLALGGP